MHSVVTTTKQPSQAPAKRESTSSAHDHLSRVIMDMSAHRVQYLGSGDPRSAAVCNIVHDDRSTSTMRVTCCRVLLSECGTTRRPPRGSPNAGFTLQPSSSNANGTTSPCSIVSRAIARAQMSNGRPKLGGEREGAPWSFIHSFFGHVVLSHAGWRRGTGGAPLTSLRDR